MNLASLSTTRLALGPGSAVTSFGSFVSIVVIISSSWEKWSAVNVDGLPQSRFVCVHPYRVRALPGEGLLSLRRRGWDAARPGRNCRGTYRDWRVSFAFPTDAAVP